MVSETALIPSKDLHKLIIMQGPSGSGKTTTIKNWKDKHPEADICIASADQFFTMPDGKYEFTKEGLSRAHIECFRRVRTAMAAGVRLIFLDNTNLCRKDIKRYLDLAKVTGYNTLVWKIETPIELCKVRNRSRNRTPTPDYIIERHFKKMQKFEDLHYLSFDGPSI